MLATRLRGKDNDIEYWISKQRAKGPNILLSDRPDERTQATKLMQNLLHAIFQDKSDYAKIQNLQNDLQNAHFANWRLFLTIHGTHIHSKAIRNTIVSDAMARIQSNRREMGSGNNSPMMLTPVSPGVMRKAPQFLEQNYWEESCTVSGAFQLIKRPLRGKGTIKTDRHYPIRVDPYNCTGSHELSKLKTKLGDAAGILYVKRYIYQRVPTSIGYEETCPLCNHDDVLLMALLKSAPQGLSTLGFPTSCEQKGLAYPLAIGSYPETDVLSSYVCCDSCAYTLTRKDMLLDDEKIVSAIPLMPSAFSGDYRQITFELIDTALQKSFHSSAVILVFLAIVHNTITNIDGFQSKVRTAALKKMARWISDIGTLHPDLSMAVPGETPLSASSTIAKPLSQVIDHRMRQIREPSSSLLQYPLSGSITILLTAIEFGLSEELCMLTVWHRFLLHLVEKHCASVVKDHGQATTSLEAVVKSILSCKSDLAKEKENPDDSSNAASDLSLAAPPDTEDQLLPDTLRDPHLLSEDELDEFRNLGDVFNPVERYEIFDLGIFLELLSTETQKTAIAIDVLNNMRASWELGHVFD